MKAIIRYYNNFYDFDWKESLMGTSKKVVLITSLILLALILAKNAIN